MIPRIIHQTWKTSDTSYGVFQRSQRSIREFLPDWEYHFWTDSDLDRFVQTEFPSFYGQWRDLDRHIKRVDIVRYLLLYRLGGAYADLDFIFTRGIEELLDETYSIFFYKSKEATVKRWRYLGNAFMISKPDQQFWLDAVNYMFTLPSTTGVVHHTGPRALGAFYHSLNPKPVVKIFDSDHFDNEKCRHGVGLKNYGYHVRTATWLHPNRSF